MGRNYKGIDLIGLEESVQFSHSKSAYIMSGGKYEADVNTDYFDILLSRQKSLLSQDAFDEISALNSVANMNYQICNGGIDQYFYNNYDKSNAPMHENDVAHIDKAGQCLMLDKLIDFGLEVFPEREDQNKFLEKVIRQFKDIYVENTEQFETIYSEEDKWIWDDDEKDWIINPDYEEPYEVSVGYEDELINAYNFDDEYYKINDYLEVLMEGYAQYLTKVYDIGSLQLDKKIIDAKTRADNKINENTNEPLKDIYQK